MEYTQESKELIGNILNGFFNVIITDRRMSIFTSMLFTALILIGLFLFFDHIFSKPNTKRPSSQPTIVDNFLRPFKLFIIGSIVCGAGVIVFNENLNINDYKSRVEKALNDKNTELDEIISLVQESQIALDTYFVKPKIINGSYYLQKSFNYPNKYNKHQDFITYHCTHLIDEENIDAVLSKYIQWGVADLDMYEEEINRKLYNQLKQ